MKDNIFADAVMVPTNPGQDNDPKRYMTRQDMLYNGFITVRDMDDEELTAGRCRGNDGRIPKVTKTLENVPRDLYDAMVAEHQMRTHERYRQHLNIALETMVDIMTSPTAEDKDKMDAAKYITERVLGKPQERVAVQVSKAPWEEIMGEVSKITYAQHQALKRGAIDAEVVELQDESVPTPVSEVHEASNGVTEPTSSPLVQVDVPQEPADRQHSVPGSSERGGGPGMRSDGERLPIDGERNDDGCVPPPQPWDNITLAPHHEVPAHSNPVVEQTLSQRIVEAELKAQAIAEARAERRATIQRAKKRRMAMRASGTDVLQRTISADPDFKATQDKLLAATQDEPTS